MTSEDPQAPKAEGGFDWTKAEKESASSFESKKKRLQPKPKKVPNERRRMRSFEPAVTRYKRSSGGKGDHEPPHPYVRKLTDLYLTQREPKYPISISVMNFDEPQYVSRGALRATIAGASLPELKHAIAFMLQRDLITQPENFARFEDLKENNGGKEILLNEISKEPPEVIEDLFQLAGRVKSRHVTKVKELVEKDGKVDLKEVKMEVKDNRYERQPRYPLQNRFRRSHFIMVPGDEQMVLLTNSGVPYDDPNVYVKHPVRSIKGLSDSMPQRIVNLCGPEMDRWFSRTAREKDKLEELSMYADERDHIARYRREICTATDATVQPFMARLQRTMDPDEPDPLHETTRSELKQLGWTDEQIESMYGEESWPPKGESLTWKRSHEYPAAEPLLPEFASMPDVEFATATDPPGVRFRTE
jgi:hypothetical protein